MEEVKVTLGFQDLKEVVVAGLALAKLGDELSDGLSFADLKAAFAVVQTIGPAFRGIEQVWPAYKALDDAGVAELEALVAGLDLKHDNVEAVIKTAINTILELHNLVGFFQKKAA